MSPVANRVALIEMDSDQEPDTETKRRILTAKRDNLRALGYEHAVNAEVARALRDLTTAEAGDRASRTSYQAAREIQRLLDALPEAAEGSGDE